MMSFCKKSVHSFLALSNPLLNIDTINPYEKTSSKSPPSPSKGALDGLGLISSAATGTHRTANVLESTTVKSASSLSLSSSSLSLLSSSSSSSSLSVTPSKKDPGGIGFIDDIGGGVDGLMSCTESLGFESSDERRGDDEIELCSSDSRTLTNVKMRKYGEKREVKMFPPPLSSFNYKGQPSFFLKPVRRDGRLELIEVRIDRPELLRASREDGRLRLHLVRQQEEEEEEEETQEEDKELFDIEEEEEEETQEEVEEEKEKEEVIKEEQEEEEENFEGEKLGEEEIKEWRVSSTNGESFVRRCHEDVVVMVTHHHYHHCEYHHHNDHHMHVWSQQCVTTR